MAVVVTAVVAFTGLVGGGGALISDLHHKQAKDAVEHAEDLARNQPGKGPSKPIPPPSTIPVPGPKPDPTVTTTVVSTTVPGSDEGGPGQGDQPSGGSVDLGHGLSTDLPDGWKVSDQADNGTILNGDGAEMDVFFYDTQSGEGADSVLERHVNSQAVAAISQFQVGDVTTASLPSANVVEAITGHGTGYVAQQSGGTLPVSSLLYVYVRSDGLGVVVMTLSEQGTFPDHQADFQTIFDGVLRHL
jgi:hypothetical protein